MKSWKRSASNSAERIAECCSSRFRLELLSRPSWYHGFSGVIAGRNAVFVCKLARYDFAGERGYLGTDAFATGKHKHEAREQQDCRKGRGD